MTRTLAVLATAALLAACTERPQTADTGRHDTPPFQGTGVATFTADGWKPGDRNSWEQELRTRTQRGQNEYGKVN